MIRFTVTRDPESGLVAEAENVFTQAESAHELIGAMIDAAQCSVGDHGPAVVSFEIVWPAVGEWPAVREITAWKEPRT